jgi:phosphomannomutase
MRTTDIKFGTDGWRGILADEFTFDNVALVGSAIVQYLRETGHSDSPLLLGYDRRFSAEAQAAHLGNHLLGLGQVVVLANEAWPTPVTAFGVQHLKAAGAIMLTASHNPHYYQGLKFIPWFAGPAMPATTDRVTQIIQELAPAFNPPRLNTEWAGETVALKDAYFSHLDDLVNINSLSSVRGRVLYSPMHGVGANYFDAYLRRASCPVMSVNTSRDVYFGGMLPDPSKENLAPLAAQLTELDCALLIGTDGDADRFGIYDAAGRYFGANHALPLLADYLIRYRGKRGRLIRTVSTSHLLDAIAAQHGLELVETAVGFKYVGDELLRGGLIGGEESGGISVQGHVPEKDGILSSLLLLELLATSGESLHELYESLQSSCGRVEYVRVDQHLDSERKQRLLDRLREYAQTSFAGLKITSRSMLDGVQFTFENGSWMLVRASGTEPIIRIYLETIGSVSLAKFRKSVLAELDSLGAAS